jgi:hypothetical protein
VASGERSSAASRSVCQFSLNDISILSLLRA